VADILLGLLEILGEIVLQVLFETAVDTVFRLNPKKEPSWTTSAFFLVIAGGVAGLISSALFPHRVITGRHIVHGISLVLAPAITGIAMQEIGNRMRAAGYKTTVLTTFRGGAVFALAMAVVRWLMVR
jgi:hypothetical protein